ncbi:family 16 glycosylhydrolase [Novosphingobium sp.]|uniref:family 16 glycosylhydrolase n=1 Tax=Novosphingobium sp. TaxID=1874826 RepID=UPI003340A480
MAVIKDFFGNTVRTAVSWQDVITIANLANGTATGTAGNDQFKMDGTGGHTLIGNGGDDVFYGVTNTDKIIEPVGYTGFATVYVSSNYTMGAGLTNMTVFWAGSGVTGNARANVIVSNTENITIDGGAGNDVLTGSAGDCFRFTAGSGYDVITNFVCGARASVSANPETVQLAGYAQFKTFADVKAAMTQVGSDVVLQLDASDAIRFQNTTIAGFSADNFLLASNVVTKRMTVTFNAEFSSGKLSASTGGGQTLWRTDYGWGDNPNAVAARTLPQSGEKQIFVDPTMISQVTGKAITTNPFSFKNGTLVISAAPAPASQQSALYGYQFTSGMLSTRDSFTQTYGYFEAKLKLPAGGGAWPAFWLYSVSGGAEIDIMESHGSDTWTATTHSFATGKEVIGASTVYTPDLSSGYHTFGLLWNATTITWYLDGVAVRRIATPADMHGPMYMMLNLGLDKTTTSSFTGASMNVAYVHAFSLDNLPATVVSGGASNDTLNDLNGATTLTGGTGNDSYYVNRTSTQVVEAAGAGTDTVFASVDYTLPTNVEKLVLTGTATRGTSNAVGGILVGNSIGSVLTGGGGADTLIGGAGNDRLIAGTGVEMLTGGGGADTFVFGATIGKGFVTDFDVKNDHLDLSALAGHAYTLIDTNGGAMLKISGAGNIFFNNVNSSALAGSSGFAVASVNHNSWSYYGTA